MSWKNLEDADWTQPDLCHIWGDGSGQQDPTYEV